MGGLYRVHNTWSQCIGSNDERFESGSGGHRGIAARLLAAYFGQETMSNNVM
jgi:hypothetical protein